MTPLPLGPVEVARGQTAAERGLVRVTAHSHSHPRPHPPTSSQRTGHLSGAADSNNKTTLHVYSLISRHSIHLLVIIAFA